MNKFETYLVNNGINFQVAGSYGRIADKYVEWLEANGLKASKIKRSQFTEWIQQCREQGNKERTLHIKENVVKHYHYFLGTKNNPAISWIRRKAVHTLPTTAIESADLVKVYESLKPKSPADYRNRCMLGLILFQGFKRSELRELRISDVNFDAGEIFVQAQLRTNSRRLKLEPFQMLHLYDYFNKYRKNFLILKENKETDRFFLSQGTGQYLENSVTGMLGKLKKAFPQIENLQHIRGSVITNWQKNEGIMEAMEKAGHRYVTSTQRYQTNKYEELQEQLKSVHPLESMNLNGIFDNK